jgi:outer membrane protein assembly factor BamB
VLRTWTIGLALMAGTAWADWPQWRGPARDGRADLAARASWPQALKPGWKASVGLGYASPVVAGDRAYVFAREGDDEVASAYDLASGRRLWRQPYRAPYTMNPAATSHGPGPKSTPAVGGGRLFTFGISGTLSCFDAASGKLVWRRTFADQHKHTSPDFGTAQSPLLDQDRLVIHVGGDGDGALLSLDASTGATRWALKGYGPAYASPVLAELDGVRQYVLQTQSHLMGVDASRGEALWTLPFTTSYEQNAVTAVVTGGLVVYSGLDRGIHAIRPRRQAGRWTAEEVWRNDELAMYMSSPVVDGKRLFGFSHRKKGEFFCLDVETGRTLWLSEGRQGDNAALVAVGRDLLLLKDDAELLVVRMGADAFAPVATYTVAQSPTWAHPVPTARGVLVKDQDSLALLRLE